MATISGVVVSPPMKEYRVGQVLSVKLSGGRIVEATITVIRQTTDGTRLQVSFSDETARIYEWQIIRSSRPVG